MSIGLIPARGELREDVKVVLSVVARVEAKTFYCW